MTDKEKLKIQVCQAIDRNGQRIADLGDRLMATPELGFKEFETAGLVSGIMKEFGVPHRSGLAITGVKGELKGRMPGPTLALLGELDSLLLSDHPDADPETGAAHACGHNAQIAGLMGAMMGLIDSSALDQMSGRVVFFAVPAEEFVEVEYRKKLVEEKQIHFLGGKPELIAGGHFNDIDLAVMIHTHSDPEMKTAAMPSSSNGCLVKAVRFLGKAAHAGGAPHKGINALNAAQLALSAIHAQRETFRDQDSIRVHPIITKGGELVNVVPAEVRLETFVRGRSVEAILDADAKVDRALRAGALAVGARVEIETLPGYMPLRNDPALQEIFKHNAQSLFGEDEYCETGHRTGSTDMGDVSHIMPALHPYLSGGAGNMHGIDWRIADPQMGYMAPAKMLAMMAVDLLFGEAEAARRILADCRPAMTKEQYLAFQRNLSRFMRYDGETGDLDLRALPVV